jgi:hypothetical protein
MADISYKPNASFPHYVDGETIVSAGGSDGFNTRFDALLAEFVAISTSFGTVNTAIKNVQTLNFVQSQPPLTLPANGASTEFQVELYDPTTLPANGAKVYFAIIFPASGSTNIRHTFLYRNAPGGKIGVTVQFFNQDGAQPAQFAFRVLTLATPS